MKRLSILSLLSISALATSSTLADTYIQVPGLYNTGVDNTGTVKPQQTVEQHYQVTGASTSVYVVPPTYNPPFGQWLPAPAGSAWVGPNSTSSTFSPDPVGTYYYTLQFNL